MPPNYRSNGHLDVTHTGNLRTNVCAELQQKLSDRCGADVDGGKGGQRKNNPRRRGGGAGVAFKATRGKEKRKKDGRFKRMHEITTPGRDVPGGEGGEGGVE